MAGGHLVYSGKDPVARGPGGVDGQNLLPGLPVRSGTQAGIAEEGLGLGGKDQGILRKGVKQGLYPKSVPEEEQGLPVPKGEGEDAL